MKKIESAQVLVGLIDQYTDHLVNDGEDAQDLDKDPLLNLWPRWTADAPKFLTDAFKDVLRYDPWIFAQLLTYGFHIVTGCDIDESSLFRHEEIYYYLEWAQDCEIRPLYVERAERDNKILSNGGSLSELFEEAQRLEIKDLIPKFAKVFDSLITQD